MKLFYSPTSPYVRKVMACAIARDIDGQIETLRTNPHERPAALLAANPLSKVPCLVTEDGVALYDSPVIAEYLDSIGDAPPLFPRPGSAARWHALKLQALGDGILDAAVGRRMEQAKPREAARDTTLAEQKAVVARAIAALEAEPPGPSLDIGSIAIACALGYLDFRFADEPWRPGHPRLAAWFAAISAAPAIAKTMPRE
ncbi:glutathione S-transferase N-terminal domain-containing protein [Acidibrevibacterium fodinaquatile]|uniref:glutathione S-transferase N-terminal domain-containing protein n=1 Tax=Acidibrevibacterium fodinaquatile TaxID=1969806 RepID=UPI000E0D2807|nr:glutathione S-transferase N-terminal domain-containing protein [Acidibrevibacterium fodinaquatile]